MLTKNKFLVNFCCFVLLSLFLSCITQINYDVSNEKTRIVINSLITSKFETQKVYVRRSVLTGTNSITNSVPVLNAAVSIMSSTEVFEFAHDKDGVYTSSFSGIEGETYVMEVVIDGQTYRSASQIMPKALPLPIPNTELINIQSLNSAGNLINDKYVNINLTGTIIDDFKALYRINGEYEFMEFNPPSTTLKTCYVSESIDNNTIKLLSAKDLRTNDIQKFGLLDVPFDARFLRLYAFKIAQYHLSDESLNYWNKVNLISNTGLNIFDAPPGKILGNIKNVNDVNDEILGNFTLGGVRDTIIFTNMVKLGGVVDDICQVRFNTSRPDVCINCLLLPFSTTIKPDYWPL